MSGELQAESGARVPEVEGPREDGSGRLFCADRSADQGAGAGGCGGVFPGTVLTHGCDCDEVGTSVLSCN